MIKEFYIGAAYYPELWDETEIDIDVERCKSFGINVLRIGEFAWSKIEPEEGWFETAWLLRVVDKLYANGIYTVMCTPTCTPPRWLMDKYDELRAVRFDGRRADISSRCHTCKTSKLMREKNAAVVTALTKVFAGHKGIIGWQIDNEIYPYDDGCYCDNCVKAFREYLRSEYGSIDALNKKWGMARWSLEYKSFDAIKPPYRDQWRHPSLRKAWWDYQCDQIKSYVDEQADILHKFGCENVGTDMMSNNYLSYYKLNEKLDTVMFNHYDRAEQLPNTAFSYDFLRCVKDKPFWVTETQIGWNGSEFSDNGFRPIGNCYANTLLPIVKGGEMNMYWLFRAHPNGHELAHGALFSSCGRSYRVTDEVKRASVDLYKCNDILRNTCIKSKIALHYSSEAMNCFSSAPMLKDFDYRRTLIDKFYSAFKHYNIDVIDTPHSLDGYDTVLSPFLSVVDEDTEARIKRFVERGGTWIVGPMSDIMDGAVTKFTHAPYRFLEDFAGVYTEYQKPLDGKFCAEFADGTPLEISMCYDAYVSKSGTATIAAYTDREFAPLSVITERAVGKGKVILLGSVPDAKSLLRLIDIKPIAEASDNVLLTERVGEENCIIAVETENKTGNIVLDGEYTEVLSGKTLSGMIQIRPYQALFFKK